MSKDDVKIISAWSQWKIQTRQYIHILLSDRKNLLVSFLFPVVAAIITVWLAGKDMFVHYEGTKSACFVIVSAAIWGGMFNSIQSVVKERANIKREHVNGLRIRCYTMSRAIIQLFICIVQSIILCCTFIGVKHVYGNELPPKGLIISNPLIEYYISILLLMYAADMMGLFISCMVKKTETANVMAPYILIVQLIFSGILFSMKGVADKISYIMLSRWGMEALGSISNINNMKLKIQMTFPDIPHETEKMFNADDRHILVIWGILLMFAIAFLMFGNMLLHRVSKDKK